MAKVYEVSSEAVRQARKMGMGRDAEKRLKRMARRSAPLTHDLGNRRFDDFILDVEGDVVVAIYIYEPMEG